MELVCESTLKPVIVPMIDFEGAVCAGSNADASATSAAARSVGFVRVRNLMCREYGQA
jgi:hypothetical protein